MKDRHDRALATLALLALLVHVSPLGAQRLPGFGGLEVRGGFASPEQADVGFSGAVDLDLGYVSSPRVRGTIGFDYFGANIDRRVEGVRVGGDFSARGAVGGVRLDAYTGRPLVPFLGASLHAYSVDASSPNAAIEDLLSGFVIGAGLSAGAGYAFDPDHRTLGVLMVRRLFANNIDHWNVQLGFRYLPRGSASYIAVPRRPAALRQQSDAERMLVQQEQERIARERRAAEEVRAQPAADTIAAQQRAEEARLAAEQQRRLAEERERAHADSVARAAEERIAAAEREAAEARARAEEAERRAAESERRMYDALMDLDRLLTNVTGVRETERGLVIVLGSGAFASGQSALSPRAREDVGRVAAVLGQFPEHRISVEGHTDAAGQELTNQRLSEQRAEAVRAALIAEGIAPQRLESVGFGQGRPIADNATAAGRAENRRVEIVVLGARRPTSRQE